MDLEDLGDDEADLFRADPAPGPSEPAPAWAPNEGPLRVVPASEASALLRIKLPDSPPVPATTLRPDAPSIDRAVDAAAMWAPNLNPSRPTALPGDVLALTTATMVVPMPAAYGRPGGAVARPTLLTASVPPDLASRAEADLLSDTVEQFFGDFDAIGRELAAERAARADAGLPAAGTEADIAEPGSAGLDPAAADPVPRPARQPGEEYGPGRYGVPTQFPGYDAARRSPVGMRYLGGIFHDSSGESSFYDPLTEALVPLATRTGEFRRPVFPPKAGAPAAAIPGAQTAATVATPRPAGPAAGPPTVPLTPVPAQQPRRPVESRTADSRTADSRTAEFRTAELRTAQARTDPATRIMPAQPPAPEDDPDADGHWTDHRPDHHRGRGVPGRRRRGRAMLVSATVVVLAFGGLYGAALALEGQVPKGTVVDGVDIGGLSRDAAQLKLAQTLGPGLTAPIRLSVGGQTVTLDPQSAGLRVDWAATVAAAADGRADPLVALPALVGSRRSFPAKVVVDRAALHDALAKATASLDRPMVDGGVTFPGGVPTPVAPHPGQVVDIDAGTENVANAFAAAAAALGAGGSAESAPGTRLGDLEPAAFAAPATPSRPPAAPAPAPARAQAPAGGPLPAAPAPASIVAPVTLTVRTLQPTVTPAEVARVMQDLARPAMAGPVTLVTGSVKTTLKPAVLGKYLAFVPDGHGALVPRLDGAGIRTEIEQPALARLEQPAVSAGFTVTGGKPVLVPGKDGTGYAPQAIDNAVLPVLTKTSAAQRVATVPLGPLPPALTTEAASALGIRDVMGTYTAQFPALPQRTANVRHAADLVRGQIVQPGAAFSLNQVLGARTAAAGYVPDSAADTTGAQDAGAGSSLVATALFNAEYLAGLKDVEHHPHASLTAPFPAGLEAASAYPDVDLKFVDDSDGPVYLWTQSTDTSVTVAVLGRKDFTAVQTEVSPHYAVVPSKSVTGSGGSCTAIDGADGFQIDVTRILTRSGQDPERQVFHTTYAPQDKVVCPAGGAAGSNGPGASHSSSGAAGASSGAGTPASSSSSGGPGGAGGGAGSTPTGSWPPPPPSSQPGLLGGLLGAPRR